MFEGMGPAEQGSRMMERGIATWREQEGAKKKGGGGRIRGRIETQHD
jgi:hypothetical protein